MEEDESSAYDARPHGSNDWVESGGQGRNRTSDTRIFSAVLYQLSYLAGGNFGECRTPRV
jgi:hypothetical protein